MAKLVDGILTYDDFYIPTNNIAINTDRTKQSNTIERIAFSVTP